MQQILVVEDDLALSAGLCFELDTAGYASIPAYNCVKAREFLERQSFALVLLDVNLPDGSGFDLCREIKEQSPNLPVIFLTANDLDTDVLNGFDIGAEDYITKPFNIQILIRRVEVALRRHTARGQEQWTDGYLQINFSLLTAQRRDEKLAITPNEYKLLKLLIGNSGQMELPACPEVRACHSEGTSPGAVRRPYPGLLPGVFRFQGHDCRLCHP